MESFTADEVNNNNRQIGELMKTNANNIFLQ